MTEPKPCPFCGKVPFQHPETQKIWCTTNGCIGTCLLSTHTDEWNARAIEDALSKRIAELEHKLANYSAAADGHTHWCPECKIREDRIAELEAAFDKAAHQLYDYSGSCPSDLFDWEHPNTCNRECDSYDNPDEAGKCWRLWLLEKPRGEK